MAGNNPLSAFNPDFGVDPAREASKSGYNQPAEGVTPESGDEEMLRTADGSFRDSLRRPDMRRGIVPLPDEPEPVPLPVPPPEPYTPPDPIPTPPRELPPGGDFDWIAPVPRPPAEQTCRCVLEVLPDISEGAYTGRFRLVGAQSVPDTYSIFGLNDDIQFRHAAGGPHNPWRNALTGTMQCGEEIEFKASARTPFTQHVVVGQWGSLTCVQEIGVEPPGPPPSGKCACDAFCIAIDEIGNISRVDTPTLHLESLLWPASQSYRLPSNRIPFVVTTEGDRRKTIPWSVSTNKYLSADTSVCVGAPDCRLPCGELDVFTVSPTEEAVKELQSGADVLTGTIRVYSGRMECGLITVAIYGKKERDEPFRDRSRYATYSGIQLLTTDKYNCEKCRLHTESECEQAFKTGVGTDGLPTMPTVVVDAWNEGCMPVRAKKALVNLCRLGWGFDEEDSTFNRGVSEYVSGTDWRTVDIEGPGYRISPGIPRIQIAGTSIGSRNDKDVCRTLCAALGYLGVYIARVDSPLYRVFNDLDTHYVSDRGHVVKALANALPKKLQEGCDNYVECTRLALDWVCTKRRNWRIINPFEIESLATLWEDVSAWNAISLSSWSASGYSTDASTEDYLAALKNTKRSEIHSPNFTSRLPGMRNYLRLFGDDVFIFYGHSSVVQGTVSLGRKWPEKLVPASDFKKAGAELTGVCTLIGCNSAVLRPSVPWASAYVLQTEGKKVCSPDELEDMADIFVDKLLSAPPNHTWSDLIADLYEAFIGRFGGGRYTDGIEGEFPEWREAMEERIAAGNIGDAPGKDEPIWPTVI
jgi:hypothetical protein